MPQFYAINCIAHLSTIHDKSITYRSGKEWSQYGGPRGTGESADRGSSMIFYRTIITGMSSERGLSPAAVWLRPLHTHVR